jgi:cytochrome c oxidase subunit II
MIIEYLIEPVSTYAREIDWLFAMIFWITGVWFVATEGVFFWLLWRFRAREGVPAQYVSGTEVHLKRWITWPHGLIIVLDLFIIVGAVRVWYMIKQDLPPAEQTVRIIAQQWAWTFIQPGADGQIDTPDDIATIDELHIQENTVYHYKLESKDVLHDFSVPVFRLKQDAIPGREITGWFEAMKTGQYDIQCAEICGIGHGIMSAQLHIESAADHAAWIAAHAPAVASN